jgi:hypothetical protein
MNGVTANREPPNLFLTFCRIKFKVLDCINYTNLKCRNDAFSEAKQSILLYYSRTVCFRALNPEQQVIVAAGLIAVNSGKKDHAHADCA